jgi:small subunit ribosomal protein S8
MLTDPIADLLTRVRNAQRAGHKSVLVRKTKAGGALLELLKSQGFIQGYAEREDPENARFQVLDVQLKYYSSGLPLITQATRVSKPGRRVYLEAARLPKQMNGLGLTIISTSQGLLSDSEARHRGIGGEIVAAIG